VNRLAEIRRLAELGAEGGPQGMSQNQCVVVLEMVDILEYLADVYHADCGTAASVDLEGLIERARKLRDGTDQKGGLAPQATVAPPREEPISDLMAALRDSLDKAKRARKLRDGDA
jgi:glutathione S-transferase